jgi:hypothetical protein
VAAFDDGDFGGATSAGGALVLRPVELAYSIELSGPRLARSTEHCASSQAVAGAGGHPRPGDYGVKAHLSLELMRFGAAVNGLCLNV